MVVMVNEEAAIENVQRPAKEENVFLSRRVGRFSSGDPQSEKDYRNIVS